MQSIGVPRQKKIPVNERIEMLKQQLDALAQAYLDVEQNGWSAVSALAYDIDDGCQVVHFDLSSLRGANPSLHAQAIKFVEGFGSLLKGILGEDNIPSDVRNKLQHFANNAEGRKQAITEMDYRKSQLAARFAQAFRTNMQKVTTP